MFLALPSVSLMENIYLGSSCGNNIKTGKGNKDVLGEIVTVSKVSHV